MSEAGKAGAKRPHADGLEAQKPAKVSKTAGAADTKAKVAEKKQRDEKGEDSHHLGDRRSELYVKLIFLGLIPPLPVWHSLLNVGTLLKPLQVARVHFHCPTRHVMGPPVRVPSSVPHGDDLHVRKAVKQGGCSIRGVFESWVLSYLLADCSAVGPGADKIVHEQKVDKRAAEEKPKSETVRKRKYSPIPAPPSKADREKAKEKEKGKEKEQAKEKKGKEEPETERSKRHKGSPEAAAKGSTAVKPAVLDRLAKKASVFDRLDNGKKAALVDSKPEPVPGKPDVAKRVSTGR